MKSVVLLSGGLDSSVNLYAAVKNSPGFKSPAEGSQSQLSVGNHKVVKAITFDYGQRAARAEIQSARLQCQKLGMSHEVIALPFFSQLGGSALTENSVELPLGSKVNISSHEISTQTAKSVWVPNRNGVFLNIAAAYAESLGADIVIPGFNAEEASTFPDNSEAYMEALSCSFAFSTKNKVIVGSYTHGFNKFEIIQLGQTLGLDWKLIWPCYQNEDRWCGQCESCLRSKRAFELAGVNLSDTGFL